MSKRLFNLALTIFFISIGSSAFAQQKGVGKGGVPNTVEELKSQISDLQEQIDTIELIEGPQGGQGIQGEEGPQGDQGPEGPKGESGVDSADGVKITFARVVTNGGKLALDINGTNLCF